MAAILQSVAQLYYAQGNYKEAGATLENLFGIYKLDFRVFNTGGDVSPPIPTYNPNPCYTPEAANKKFQGTTALWIVVDAEGNVREVLVVKPLGMGLDERAVRTIKTWKFRPAMRSSVPVAVHLFVETSFSLF